LTWHAARFLLYQAVALALAAAAVFFAWALTHRRHHYFKRISGPLRIVVAIVIIAAAVFFFVQTLRSVLTDGSVAAADLRMYHTLRMFSSEALHAFYSDVTNLASTIFIVPVALALAVMFWTHRRRNDARIFVAAIIGAEILSVTLKYIVRRQRPPEAVHLVGGPSFPSGHTLTATAVYGILAFLLLREKPRTWWHIALAVVLVSVIVLVPISRVYLGVHWLHDVLASLDLGCALLACLTMLVRFHPDGTRRTERPEHIRARWIGGLAAGVIVYAIVLARFRFVPEARPLLTPPAPRPAAVLNAFPGGLQRTSEDLVGGAMEPVSFIFVGGADDLQRAFTQAGWTLAETPSVRGLATELWDVIRDRPDPHGPATPAYYAAQPQDLTFEKPGTASGSIRHRHHIRIWRAPICIAPSCTTVWAATCSYDLGIEFVAKPYLLTHRIDPNIDHEREYIASGLRGSGATDAAVVTVTGARHGKNAGGDAFTTDGRAHIMLLTSVHE